MFQLPPVPFLRPNPSPVPWARALLGPRGVRARTALLFASDSLQGRVQRRGLPSRSCERPARRAVSAIEWCDPGRVKDKLVIGRGRERSSEQPCDQQRGEQAEDWAPGVAVCGDVVRGDVLDAVRGPFGQGVEDPPEGQVVVLLACRRRVCLGRVLRWVLRLTVGGLI